MAAHLTPEPSPLDLTRRDSADAIGWVASLFVHAGLLLLVSLLTIPSLVGPPVPALTSEPSSPERPDEAADLLTDAETLHDLEDSLTDAVQIVTLEDPTLLDPGTAGGAVPTLADTTAIRLPTLTSPVVADLTGLAGEGTVGRAEGARKTLVASKGGSAASEQAVARGLKWIAEHQNTDGTWSLLHQTGACRGRCPNPSSVGDDERAFRRSLTSGTGLALLPFLGAGQTHLSGRHRATVDRGLRALVRLAEIKEGAPGASWMDSGQLYSHAICAIVLAEAYGMTRDPDLIKPAQAAIDFIVHAQDPEGGGWRYQPRQPGDLSATGWHVMALKSASLAELSFPPRVTRRVTSFLDSVQLEQGSRYRYMPPKDLSKPGKGTRTQTAVGLLCRMYLDWKQHDARLARGLEWVVEQGPSENNFYRNYYVAQTLFHQTGGEGPVWRAWNEPMRNQLMAQQEKRGHARGSWWVEGPHNARGGRLYTTSLATMTLEVYYRYLPLYQAAAVETAFPE